MSEEHSAVREMDRLDGLLAALLGDETDLVEELALEGMTRERKVVLRLVQPASGLFTRIVHR